MKDNGCIWRSNSTAQPSHGLLLLHTPTRHGASSSSFPKTNDGASKMLHPEGLRGATIARAIGRRGGPLSVTRTNVSRLGTQPAKSTRLLQ
eukprot:2604749-Pyramimonas_sp.AAC.1